jgi:hypothetical protein
MGQVAEIEALVSVPHDFRFTVFNLWAKYLQVTEVAFSKKWVIPHASKALSNRFD